MACPGPALTTAAAPALMALPRANARCSPVPVPRRTELAARWRSFLDEPEQAVRGGLP
jgi:hypothetical protein